MKKLSELCQRIKIIDSNIVVDYEIHGIETDSNKIRENYIFVVTDGNKKFVKEAIQNGAVCFICEEILPYLCVQVSDVRESLAILASNFYDNPEKNLKIIGVVGTNGKTSITNILYKLIKPFKKVAVIGTLGVEINGKKYESDMTSPDPQMLFYFLKEAVKEKVEYVFCEISAHAIYYKKFFGITCDICVFTNITQDHLDFFKDMESYASVKTGYFNEKNMKTAVINVDDEYGRNILKNINICSISYGLNNPCDVFAVDIEENNGLNFVVNAFDEIFYAETRFAGTFNVYNILAAITVARLIGVGCYEIEKQIKNVTPIEGRANLIWSEPKVVIDFAHTPDGIKNILQSVKEQTKGRLIAVFGCGGNRDKEKRPIMAQIATDIASICVFTSDNPRYEDPNRILDDMTGSLLNKNYVRIVDRTNAIEFALKHAGKNDSVVICGKGGENYIDRMGKKYPYSDKNVCLSVLEKLNCKN